MATDVYNLLPVNAVFRECGLSPFVAPSIVVYSIQVAQLSQRDRATHELLRFVKLRSGIFEPPFGELRGKVSDLSISRWKARDRLAISDK